MPVEIVPKKKKVKNIFGDDGTTSPAQKRSFDNEQWFKDQTTPVYRNINKWVDETPTPDAKIVKAKVQDLTIPKRKTSRIPRQQKDKFGKTIREA